MDDSALTDDSPFFAEPREDLPFAREAVVLSKLDDIELKAQCNFYKAQHEKALAREAALQKQLDQAKAKIRDLNQRLYGKKSEQSKATEDKASYRWYLWVTQSPSVVYYHMAPGRDAGVPLQHFGELEEGQFPVFLVCDRYSAYKKLAKVLPVIRLAFCWAHVRLHAPSPRSAKTLITNESPRRSRSAATRSSRRAMCGLDEFDQPLGWPGSVCQTPANLDGQ